MEDKQLCNFKILAHIAQAVIDNPTMDFHQLLYYIGVSKEYQSQFLEASDVTLANIEN